VGLLYVLVSGEFTLETYGVFQFTNPVGLFDILVSGAIAFETYGVILQIGMPLRRSI